MSTAGHPRFLALLEKIKTTHIAKGSDYSRPDDILSNLRGSEDIGIPAWKGTFLRLSDKYERIKNLIKKEALGEGPAVKDESIFDTLVDLASYALLVHVLKEEGGRIVVADPKALGQERRASRRGDHQ